MSVIQLVSAVPRWAPACVRVRVCARASLRRGFDNIRLLGVNLRWSKRLTVCACACRAQIKVELSGARTACCLPLLLLLLCHLPLNHNAPSIGRRRRGNRGREVRKRCQRPCKPPCVKTPKTFVPPHAVIYYSVTAASLSAGIPTAMHATVVTNCFHYISFCYSGACVAKAWHVNID